MNSDRINKIYQSIEKLKNDLKAEYEKLQVKYDFLIKNKKIIFSEEIKSYQKSRLKENVFSYIFTANIKNLVSVPFIYSIIFPAIFLDLILTIYQFTAFPLYGIPRVSRKEYFVYDRRFLKYLNLLQKINCLYCSYVNGLFLFSVEIGSRTEQYWCPIKHSTGGYVEGRYANHYADYGDPDKFNEIFNENICFKKK